jgi:hypothetical protein
MAVKTLPTVSMYEVISRNLRRAHIEAELTQDEVIQRLEPYVVTPWTRSKLTHAETGSQKAGQRTWHRHSANDLLAYSKAFAKPLLYFLLPPDQLEECWFGNEGANISKAELVDLLLRVDVIRGQIKDLAGADEVSEVLLRAAYDRDLEVARRWAETLQELTAHVVESVRLREEAMEMNRLESIRFNRSKHNQD